MESNVMESNFRLQQLLKQVNYFLLGKLLGKMISYLFVLRFLIWVKKLFLVVNEIMHLGTLAQCLAHCGTKIM